MSELRMPQLNVLTISGRLVFDGKLERSAQHDYSRNRIACDEGFGEKKTTSFFGCVAFGKTAAMLAECRKGEPVILSGSIRINKRERGEEVKEEPEITIQRIERLSWHDDGKRSDAQKASAPKQSEKPQEEDNDDLPF